MRRTAVRPAAPADLDAAAGLAASRSATKWTRAALSEELLRPDSVFLVTDDVRGYAVARIVDEELRLLDIVSATDGEGAGRALWAHLVVVGKQRGAKKLTLEVSDRNVRALRFYGAAGATVVGKRPKFYADGSAAVLMDVTLSLLLMIMRTGASAS